MNHIVITGNLTADPVIRSTPNGKEVCSFRVAVNEHISGNDITTFFDCSAWEKLGNVCNQYLTKGVKVSVFGRASCKPYIGKDGKAYGNVIISVSEIDFISKANKPKSDADEMGLSDFTDISPAEIPF